MIIKKIMNSIQSSISLQIQERKEEINKKFPKSKKKPDT